jgi:toxin-antitoxin system PIN domain toxin
MTSLIFPDLNVWMALSLQSHSHNTQAWSWYRSLRGDEELAFCRMTQIGLLRLLTTERAVGKDTLTQMQAWAVFDGWIKRGGTTYLDEPYGLEIEFCFYSDRKTPSPKEWADSYLVAFAAAASLPLVTFDRGLSQRYARSILLA